MILMKKFLAEYNTAILSLICTDVIRGLLPHVGHPEIIPAILSTCPYSYWNLLWSMSVLVINMWHWINATELYTVPLLWNILWPIGHHLATSLILSFNCCYLHWPVLTIWASMYDAIIGCTIQTIKTIWFYYVVLNLQSWNDNLWAKTLHNKITVYH